MTREIVLDTTVVQKANAPLTQEPKAASLFRKRVALLDSINRGNWTVLFSPLLTDEYARRVPAPRNDFIRAFFELMTHPSGNAVQNWPRWPGGLRQRMFDCRFPGEDEHVLRTAYRPDQKKATILVTEEDRMLTPKKCIRKEFNVDIKTI